MPVIQIATPFNIDIEFEIAEFYKRMLAYLIDFILLILYMFSILYLLYGGFKVGEGSRGLVLIVMVIPTLFYTTLSEILMNGQTLGKKLLKIKVVSLDGGEPTLGQYLLRWFMRFYEWGFIVFTLFWSNGYIGFVWPFIGGITSVIIMGISHKNQRLGDIVAGTVVVNTGSNLTVNDTIFMNVTETNYKVLFPEVMRLSDRDINSLKGILDTARKKGDYDLAEMASNKIRNHLQIQTTLSAFDFLEVLLKDYNYLSAN